MIRWWVVALLLCASAGVHAQACPKPREIKHADLLGFWRAEFQGLWQGATVLLEKHPEDADRYAGGINRNGEKGVIAAEVEDGEFMMEESLDGTHIHASWQGEIVDGSCGKEIRGVWRLDKDNTERAFVLKKMAE